MAVVSLLTSVALLVATTCSVLASPASHPRVARSTEEVDQSPAASGYYLGGAAAPLGAVEYVGEPGFVEGAGYIVPEKIAYGPVGGAYPGKVFYGAPLVGGAYEVGHGGHDGYISNGGGHKNYYGGAKEGGFYGGDEIYNAKGAVGKAGYYGGGGGGKGQSGYQSYGGYGEGQQAEHKDKADVGYYGGNSGLKKGYGNEGSFNGGQHFGTNGVAVASAGSKGGHKKGHHVSGFHNTYHKDESGKNSRYYDDSDDQGEHVDYNAEDKGFGYNGGEQYKGGHVNSAYDEGGRGTAGRIGGGFAAAEKGGHGGSYGGQAFHGQKTGFGGNRAGHEYYDVGDKFSKGGEQFYKGGGGASGGTAGFYGGGHHTGNGGGYYY
ncbi:keratin, type I cytoskeletal 9-like [Ischnura elegans]|uniref:keratin, type I cytoskeletal 9-like n=1 Tax=Ischnura elegans TaxID=197161 RepID=UPI001ED88276|nr:keratin, type I cytoskeletal 9-like [Ischnura elegans]